MALFLDFIATLKLRSTINNHLASLPGFCSWMGKQPQVFSPDNPTKGIGELGTPPLTVRALSEDQVSSLKSVCDRLDRFYRFKGQRWADQLTPSASGPCTAAAGPGHYLYASFYGPSPGGVGQARFGSIGPNDPEKLRKAKKAKLTRVRGKNKSEREVFLSVDARDALADYIEKERPFRPAGLIEFPPPPDVRKAVWSIVDQGKIGEDRAICPRNEK